MAFIIVLPISWVGKPGPKLTGIRLRAVARSTDPLTSLRLIIS